MSLFDCISEIEKIITAKELEENLKLQGFSSCFNVSDQIPISINFNGLSVLIPNFDGMKQTSNPMNVDESLFIKDRLLPSHEVVEPKGSIPETSQPQKENKTELAVLKEFKKKLELRVNADNYQNLSEDIDRLNQLISQGLFQEKLTPIKKELEIINLTYLGFNKHSLIKLYEQRTRLLEEEVPNNQMIDLITMFFSSKNAKDANENLTKLKALDTNNSYLKFPTNEEQQPYLNHYDNYLVADIRQGTQYQLGTSAGECSGFTLAMADSSLTPFGKSPAPNKRYTLNTAIHNYQKNQNETIGGPNKLKRHRISQRTFHVGAKAQAQHILSVAKKVQGEHLYLSLDNNKPDGFHACYFQYLNNNRIRFADPNGKAYEFKQECDFIRFYKEHFKDLYENTVNEFMFIEIETLKNTNLEACPVPEAKTDNTWSQQWNNSFSVNRYNKWYEQNMLPSLHNFQANYCFKPIKDMNQMVERVSQIMDRYCTNIRESLSELRQRNYREVFRSLREQQSIVHQNKIK